MANIYVFVCGSGGKKHTYCLSSTSLRQPVHAVCLYERLSDDVIDITHLIRLQQLWPQENISYFAGWFKALGALKLKKKKKKKVTTSVINTYLLITDNTKKDKLIFTEQI